MKPVLIIPHQGLRYRQCADDTQLPVSVPGGLSERTLGQAEWICGWSLRIVENCRVCFGVQFQPVPFKPLHGFGPDYG